MPQKMDIKECLELSYSIRRYVLWRDVSYVTPMTTRSTPIGGAGLRKLRPNLAPMPYVTPMTTRSTPVCGPQKAAAEFGSHGLCKPDDNPIHTKDNKSHISLYLTVVTSFFLSFFGQYPEILRIMPQKMDIKECLELSYSIRRYVLGRDVSYVTPTITRSMPRTTRVILPCI